MPPRKYRKSKGVRMRLRKRKGNAKRKMVNVNRSLQPFPQRYICKVKYAQCISLDTSSSATGIAAYRWRLNSIYDPDWTATGATSGAHRPYGTEKLLGTSSTTGLYNRYRVISATYNIYAVPGAGQNIHLTALPANTSVSTGSNNASALRESPRCRYVAQTTGAPIRLLKGKVYMPSLVGRNKSQYMADDRYQAEWNADPLEAALLNVYLSEMSDAPGTGVGAVPVQAKISIEITYTVELFDQVQQPQSQL